MNFGTGEDFDFQTNKKSHTLRNVVVIFFLLAIPATSYAFDGLSGNHFLTIMKAQIAQAVTPIGVPLAVLSQVIENSISEINNSTASSSENTANALSSSLNFFSSVFSSVANDATDVSIKVFNLFNSTGGVATSQTKSQSAANQNIVKKRSSGSVVDSNTQQSSSAVFTPPPPSFFAHNS